MVKPIIGSIVCLLIFIGLLQGTHHMYVAVADNELGLYAVAALVCVMWASLFGVVLSLFFPQLKALWLSIKDD
ncbi:MULTISPECIES: hypothetical protein [Shewanella]|uniref:hypothetical protein n=1 Tax=Shewanella TaxID=22 RepID=UPI00048CA9C1|nr:MULTISPECIES: hypothetical protein [Shewanella]QLE86743.1 hypothetical protein FLM48_17705 [Shewanella sp. Scap07]